MQTIFIILAVAWAVFFLVMVFLGATGYFDKKERKYYDKWGDRM